MNTRQQHGEPERKEGLGGRVRRFVDQELSRVLDKEDRGADPPDHRREPDQLPGSDRADESEQVTHREAVTAYPDPSARAEPAMATAPAPSAPDEVRPNDGVEEAQLEQLGARSSEETAADAGAERVGLLNDPTSLRDEWQRVQGTFVDDPQRAVREASELVERTLQEIHRNVTSGQARDPSSTEDLRVSFQRYREFFQRLLSA